MNSKWPELWHGQTSLDCGADGAVLATVHTDAQPNDAHRAAFEEIDRRWNSLWPEFKSVVTDLMKQYDQGSPDWRNVRVLSISLPTGGSAVNLDWDVGVVFAGSDTEWDVPFVGWQSVPEKVQASW